MKILLVALFTLISTVCNSAPYEVVRIIDGDTIVIKDESGTYKARLIGIDTPETKHPRKGVQYYGKEAYQYTTDKLLNKTVDIEFDVGKYDRYKRLLVYVWVGGELHNANLIKYGYAKLMTIQPNVKYVDEFKKLQKEAREKNRGLWNTAPF